METLDLSLLTTTLCFTLLNLPFVNTCPQFTLNQYGLLHIIIERLPESSSSSRRAYANVQIAWTPVTIGISRLLKE
jgi:hypothetical protein